MYKEKLLFVKLGKNGYEWFDKNSLFTIWSNFLFIKRGFMRKIKLSLKQYYFLIKYLMPVKTEVYNIFWFNNNQGFNIVQKIIHLIRLGDFSY